ncbi:MAG: zinc transporter, ZIP family [Parcubacteria group bacterium Gr01-1014_17]|nr:MAG: zinc transporter, ZIP family [Parcubacteria group bacterium Gr01-1014_17]
MLILIAIAAFVATMLGGLFALRLKDRLHLILGFSAGAVLGVAFFDLLPEAVELAGEGTEPSFVFLIVALGFTLYLLLDRLFFLHGHGGHEHTDEDAHAAHCRLSADEAGNRGAFGAGSLSAHSFIDGLAVGLAFKVSPAIGLVVALAVLAHNFSDGINTVSMILKNAGSRAKALRWLLVDALAPVAGIALSYFFVVRAELLGLILALFAGSFLYIGASDLLPESHHAHPVRWTTISTVLGIGALFLITRFAGV